jgi:signal transduction histidine kinase
MRMLGTENQQLPPAAASPRTRSHYERLARAMSDGLVHALDEALDSALHLACQGATADLAAVFERRGDDRLRLRNGIGWRQDVLGEAYPLSAAGLAELPAETTAITCGPASGPAHALLANHRVSGGLLMPLIGDAAGHGLLALYRRGPAPFTPEQVAFAEATAVVVSVALGRQQLIADARRAARQQATGQLCAGLFTHALLSILGQLDLAATYTDRDGPLRYCIDAAQDIANRAADLLATCRQQTTDCREIDLNALVRDLIPMLSRLLGDAINVEVHAAPVPPRVWIDPGLFEQVLLNLAFAAQRAMPSGGQLVLETAAVALDAEAAELYPGIEPGHYGLLAVSDTGVGMDAVALEHCFEPFYTVGDGTRGGGLGLATCHGIVSQHGGHMSVYSEPGHGTTFRIFLPVKSPAAAPAPPPQAPARPSAARGSETILLVEDEELVRSIAARTLRERGYNVVEAADGEEALARLKESSAIDLLLSDVVLPEIKGPDLARRVREASPATRVLFTSGFGENVVAHHGVPAETPVLSKPYTPASLAVKVREVLDQRAG